MTTIDDDLARVRADLRAAVQRDIRRRKRRRRIARLVIVPAVVLTGASAAVAVAPQLGDPAPKSLSDRIESLHEGLDPRLARQINGPDGKRLTLAAIGEGALIYGALEPSGAWCAVNTTMAGEFTGWTCHEAAKAGRPDEVVFISLGGGTAPGPNFVSGRVGHPAARTVRVQVPGHSGPVETPVQRLGFFIADLPESTPSSQHPPSVSAEALDEHGNVVARSSDPNAAGWFSRRP